MNFNQLTKKKVGFISLGCDKNRVDLEKIIYSFKSAGFEITPIYEEANIIIINTCSFILDARKESINTILETAPLKSLNLEKLIVTGCLNNMGYGDLASSLPEVDLFVNIEDNEHIVELVCELYGVKYPLSTISKGLNRTLTTPNHYAYLKIADGCDNFCTYCTIPYIRGRFKSESLEDVVNNAKSLVALGVKEIILVAQDVTKYGYDIYGKPNLVKLLQELEKIRDLKWIRLLYCYPDLIDDKLIKEMARNKKVCHYIDIPLQHVADPVLKKMNRRTNNAQINDIIDKLRFTIPDISIRTTFILGFPGETEEDFNTLCQFVTDKKLDNVGFFKYSKEEGTPASKMPNQIPQKIKADRLKKLSNIQYSIVKEKHDNQIGQVVECVVDEIVGKWAICHSEQLCPTVDSVIYIPNENVEIGKIYKVKIINTRKYDYIGEIL
jgi:ribosomal protein S12 methylthiotransferase